MLVAFDNGAGRSVAQAFEGLGEQRRFAGAGAGDQVQRHDAERIRATGTPAIQVNTGKGCHLDAQMVEEAMARLPLADNGVLFIENVGNLVCPAGFDLGERPKMAG
ncbi:GTP-binding protein, partial [Cronobacter malonaticus]